MDDPKIQAAVKHYEAMRRAQVKYYQKNQEKIKQTERDRYRAKNPNPNPPGRPRKVVLTEEEAPSPEGV